MKKANLFILMILIATLSIFTILPNLERVWSDEVIATIPVGNNPRVIEYNPSNNYLYVSNHGTGDISVINGLTNSLIDTIPLTRFIFELEYNPSNNDIYATTNVLSNSVFVIYSSTNTVKTIISPGGSYPTGLEYNPSNDYIYVANHHSGGVAVIDSSNNVRIVQFPKGATYNFVSITGSLKGSF